MANENILVLSNDRDVCAYICAWGKQQGCEVETTSDSWYALQSIDRNSPVAALVEVSAPRGDGMGFLDWLANIKRDTPVIAIANNSAKTTVKRALKRGLTACVYRPLDTAVLRSHVEAAFVRHKRGRKPSRRSSASVN